MKILFTADWHIKLGQRHVPKVWQIDRLKKMVSEINQAAKDAACDLIIIGGDIFDRFDPSAEEMELYYNLISMLEVNTWIFTGNHEMLSKTKSVLAHYADETTRCNPLVEIVGSFRSDDFDIIDYSELHAKKWKDHKGKICFTHVRGEIKPHVVPEVDLELFNCYDLVFAGDLHSYQNTQSTKAGVAIVYPGSPITTSFHRERTKNTNGYILINTETMNYSWHDLGHLPQLIRKTIHAAADMVEDEYDRVIYEIEGSLDELKSVKDSDLLDKRINKGVSKEATLSIPKDATTSEELALYFTKVHSLEKEVVDNLISRFKKVVKHVD